MKSVGKKDNDTKEFEKKVRQEEKRLLQMIVDEEAARFVSAAH